MNKYLAELIGTFWLVLGGCGSAVLAANIPGTHLGIAYVGVSLAFGLTVLTMAYAIGHISGCHLNPAVSIGLWAGGRFEKKELGPYIAAQVIGAIIAGAVLYIIASGQPGWTAGGFATNGFGDLSPHKYGFFSVLVCEVVMTAIFLFVIMGATDERAPAGLAPVAIGLCLTLIHLVSIPVSNTSVNPARSTGVALFAGAGPLLQLWLFWLAPIVGGIIGAKLYRCVACQGQCTSQCCAVSQLFAKLRGSDAPTAATADTASTAATDAAATGDTASSAPDSKA
ncbi:MAG: aquaporin Z [Ottowia sp.]|nr:aquaporin Z [Ottowia sp.]